MLSPLGPLKTFILFRASAPGCPPGFQGLAATWSAASLLGGWEQKEFPAGQLYLQGAKPR